MRNLCKFFVPCALLLAMVCMLATWAGAEQNAAKHVTLDGVNYRLEDGAAYIEDFDYLAPRIEVHAIVDGLPMMTRDVTALAYGKATELVLCEGIESIGRNSFSHWGLLKTVYLPESLMQWDSLSFYHCQEKLAFVVWPGSYAEVSATSRDVNHHILGAAEEDRLITQDGVTYRLQDGAAYIESVDFLSERIEVHTEVDGLPMRTKAFYCDKSNDLDVPERVREVVLCEGIEVLADHCFALLCDLERVVLPQSLRRINIQAFQFTQSLQSLELPEGLTTIDGAAFVNSGLQEIVIPEGVLKIRGSAFENTYLTQVILPDSLQSIGYSAFADTQLTEVRIPSGVQEISPNAFSDCKDLFAIEVDPKNENFSSLDGVLFDKTGQRLLLYPAGRGGIYEIAEGVVLETETGLLFRGAHLLEAVTIPRSITALPDSMFRECLMLSNVSLPETLTHIGEYAFSDCAKLSNLRIPAGVQTIGENAFFNCAPGFTIIGQAGSYAETYARKNGIPFRPEPSEEAIYAVVSGVRYLLLSGRAYVDSIDAAAVEIQLLSEVSGMPVERTALSLIPMADEFTRHAEASEVQAKEITLCEGVEVIVGRCFAGYRALERIALPQSLREIGPEAFMDTESLQSITLPHETEMGRAAFKRSGLLHFDVPEGIQYLSVALLEDTPLESVTLPESLTTIGDRAFAGTRLRHITLPMRVDSLANNVFDGAAFLESIEIVEGGYYVSVDGVLYDHDLCTLYAYPEGKTDYMIPYDVRSFEDDFRDNRALERITYAENTIFLDLNELNGCAGLREIVLPETLETIYSNGSMPPPKLENLHELRIPPRVREISADVFRNCAPGFTIVGMTHSYAAVYARENSIAFRAEDPDHGTNSDE